MVNIGLAVVTRLLPVLLRKVAYVTLWRLWREEDGDRTDDEDISVEVRGCGSMGEHEDFGGFFLFLFRG